MLSSSGAGGLAIDHMKNIHGQLLARIGSEARPRVIIITTTTTITITITSIIIIIIIITVTVTTTYSSSLATSIIIIFPSIVVIVCEAHIAVLAGHLGNLDGPVVGKRLDRLVACVARVAACIACRVRHIYIYIYNDDETNSKLYTHGT